MFHLESVLDEINMSDIELIEEIIRLTNFDFCVVHSNSTLSSKEESIIHSGSGPKPTIKSIFGDVIYSNDAVDNGVDIAMEAISLIIQYNDYKKFKKTNPVNQKDKNGLPRKLLYYANVLNILRSLFDVFENEFIEIKASNEKISFNYYPEHYYILKEVGKARYNSHLHEPYYYRVNSPIEKSFIPNIQIKNSAITLQKTNDEYDNKYLTLNTSVLVTYYWFLHGIKISNGYDIYISDIFNLIMEIQSALLKIEFSKELDYSVENQTLSNIPIKINKKNLSKFLTKTTKINANVVNKLLGIISDSLSNKIDLWKTPLISHGDYYYFTFASLSLGHIVYMLDKISDKVLSKHQLLKYFISFVIDELNDLDHEYLFSLLDRHKINAFLKKPSDNFLVYEMREHFVFLKVTLFDFPISPKEYKAGLMAAAKEAEELNTIVTEIATKIDPQNKKIIDKIILTNYPVLSGLIIEGCNILDITLLKNYVSLGKYQRTAIAFGERRVSVGEPASYNYYESEDEFNANFSAFCFEPNPISENLIQYQIKDIKVTEGLFPIPIITNTIDDVTQASINKQYINKLNYYLKQLYYFNNELSNELNNSRKNYIEGQINFYLPIVFNLVAFENADRSIRINIITNFESVGLRGFASLLFLMNNLLNQLLSKKIKKHEPVSIELNNVDLAISDLENILAELRESNVIISLSTCKINYPLSDERLNNLIGFFIAYFQSATPKYLTIESLTDSLNHLIVFGSLSSREKKYSPYFYSATLNFVDLLNYNFLYQKARDFSEEVLQYSFENETTPYIGWLTLLKCSVKQENNISSGCYANFLLSILISSDEVQEELLFDVLYNVMLFFRSIGNLDLLAQIFKILSELGLNEYDKQKIHLSYYNGMLLSSIEEVNVILPDIKSYLEEHVNGIIKYLSKGALPWLSLVYNIKNLISEKHIQEDDFWDEIAVTLEQTVEPAEFENIRNQFFHQEENAISSFKTSLLRIFETRSFSDFSNEKTNLQLLANKIAKKAIVTTDFDLLFITGLLLNDQSLTFSNTKIASEQTPFENTISAELESKLNQYKEFIFEKLIIKPTQLICWLFNIHSAVFVLFIDPKKQCTIIPLPNWNLSEMHNWVKKMSDFYFSDKGDYSINAQEDDYIKTLVQLKHYKIDSLLDFGEILLYSSIQLAEFPFNLISTTIGAEAPSLENHEQRVIDYAISENVDFISFHKPISNIISIEWFVENGLEIVLKKDKFTIESWCPIVDEDFVLQLSYEKIRPILEDQYKSIIYTERIPSKNLTSTINIFLAHGGKDFEGFRTIYTKENEGHAFVKGYGISKLFGQGTIAIIFVCNSAYITKELFSERLVSFTNEILSLGYKAVIAPAWGLNPDITSIWLEHFLHELQNGTFLNRAVHLANLGVAKKGYDEYHGFYSPTGWACMHLYGNPNIRFDIST